MLLLHTIEKRTIEIIKVPNKEGSLRVSNELFLELDSITLNKFTTGDTIESLVKTYGNDLTQLMEENTLK